MKTVQEKYNAYKSQIITREKLLYEIRRDDNLKSYISNLTSFDDTIKILKNRGIITEAAKKVEALTLDTANPYEVRKGIDIELELCFKPSIRIEGEELIKVQSKVLKNLAKDPNFYSKTYGGYKPTTKPDLASDADFGRKTKRNDVSVPVKGENFNDTKNAIKALAKIEKENVKDTLGNKERAKQKNPKGVKLMTMVPHKQKGVKVMDMPGKEKKIKMNEDKNVEGNLKSGSNVLSKKIRISTDFQQGRSTTLNQNITLEENIPASTSSMVPFAKVKPGMRATDDSGDSFKILALGNYNEVRRYDSSKSFDKFLSSDPSGIDATQLVALIDKDGNTFVRVYGTGGVYVFNNQQEAIVVKPNTPEADPNNLKKYTDKGLDVKLDNSNNNNMHESYLGEDEGFESEISKKEIPEDNVEQAEAEAAILVTVTKAHLQGNIEETVVRGGFIWVRVSLGHGVLDNEQLKSLTSDSKFAGLNPISDTELSLIFKKS